MKRIIVFETIRPLMVRLGVHSWNLNEPKNEFFRSFGAHYIMYIAFVYMIISSGVFIFGNLSDFATISEPLLVALAGLQMVSMFISLGLNSRNVKALHLELQTFIDQGIQNTFNCSVFSAKSRQLTFVGLFSAFFQSETDSDEAIFNMYWNIEQKCQQFKRIVFLYFYFHPVMFGGALLYSFYCMLTGNYDTTTWILSYKLSVPFDKTTVDGWYLFWLISIQIGIPYSLAMILLMSYFAGCCYYIIGICYHFKLVISSINNSLVVGKKRYRIIKETLSRGCHHP